MKLSIKAGFQRNNLKVVYSLQEARPTRCLFHLRAARWSDLELGWAGFRRCLWLIPIRRCAFVFTIVLALVGGCKVENTLMLPAARRYFRSIGACPMKVNVAVARHPAAEARRLSLVYGELRRINARRECGWNRESDSKLRSATSLI